MIGTKFRTLTDHGAPRDLIDVLAASLRWNTADLEEFGRHHARGRFEREDLQANLAGSEWTDDEAFATYGLDPATSSGLTSQPARHAIRTSVISASKYSTYRI